MNKRAWKQKQEEFIEETQEKLRGPLHYTARQLIEMGYQQVSRSYRIVSRIPPGAKGKDILVDTKMLEHQMYFFDENCKPKSEEHLRRYRKWIEDERKWVNMLGERSCHSHYLRVYSKDKLTLDEKTFRAFRHFGGRAA
jgi:hypothetical protein